LPASTAIFGSRQGFATLLETTILDAVANPQEYTAGLWMDSVFDTEKTYRGSPPERIVSCDECALTKYAGSNATAEDLAQMINDALQEIDDPSIQPKSVIHQQRAIVAR
jgi:hypothetical protein